tara:strand:- start:6342 stop:7475 length:1134 start_codon:yes stop_codon:yes gene_type:complete
MALIEITLTIDGQAGPFDLFSNVDNYVNPFETQVPAASLTGGYITSLAPPNTSIVRICSTGVCTNCIDVPTNCPTTTTTTSSSTSTTTSTSTSTSTTTTEVPPNRFNWELITNTPGSLIAADPQKSTLTVTVNAVEVVNVAITGSASSASGSVDILPGDIVAANIFTQREGMYNFIHTIVEDGIFYQPQDECLDCFDDYTTVMSPNFVGAGVDVDFSFVADTYKELTTTTTTTIAATTTTTTSSTSSTTTTTTTCDCSLNGASVTLVSGSTTTTTTLQPTTTTTTTNAGANIPGLISTLFTSNLAVGICDYAVNQFVWKTGTTTVAFGDFLFTQSGGSVGSVFDGDSKYWHANFDGDSYIVKVNSLGEITYVTNCNP